MRIVLSSVLLVVSCHLSVADTDFFELMTSRINAVSLSGSGVSADSIRSLATSLKSDGSWSDIDYEDESTHHWHGAKHWDRIFVMSRALRLPGSPWFGSQELIDKINLAISMWHSERPMCRAFWWNGIGVPILIGKSFLLLQDDVPVAQRRVGIELMKFGVEPEYYNYSGSPATGQNLVWVATAHLMAGILERNEEALKRAFSAIEEIVIVTTEEGIQPDFSFHQHGAQLYSGGYGLGFSVDMARLIALSENTPYAFSPETIRLFTDFLLEGQQWMIRGETFDHSAVGREISRPVAPVNRLHTFVDVMSKRESPRQRQFEVMARRLKGEALPLTGNRHFWRSDYMTHHRVDYASSLKMVSNRILRGESSKSENLLGYYLGRGVQLIYRDGNEYKNIFPVWDWRKLPGHLCEQSSDPLPLQVWGRAAEGTTSFVGGASNGIYGAAAFDYHQGTVRAKRAWFHFDDEIVALVSGVTSDSQHALVQTVNQCRLRGDVVVSQRERTKPLEQGEHELDEVQWAWHDSVGYFFPDSRTVNIRNNSHSGSWRHINNNLDYSDQVVHLDLFTLWLDLGNHVRDARYAYIVRPGLPLSEMTAYKNPIEVLRNEPELQAVRHRDLDQIQAVFYKSGTLEDKGRRISMDNPGIVIAEYTNRGMKITASDPATESSVLTVRVNGNYICDTCSPAGRRGTAVTMQLPRGENAGQSVKVELLKQ